MTRFLSIAALLLMSVPSYAGIAGSVLTFTGAELDAMTIQSVDPGFMNVFPPATPADDIVPSPTYFDGFTAMTGEAGANGLWLSAGLTKSVYYGTTFAPLDLDGVIDTVAIHAFNDNGAFWGFDVWIETVGDGRVSSDVVVISGSDAGGKQSATVELDLAAKGVTDLKNIIGWGVSVHGDFTPITHNPSVGDAFHASWSPVPEPSSFAIFGLISGLAVTARRRRK